MVRKAKVATLQVGANHRAAAQGLLEGCALLRACSTGSAKVTRGYNLPASRVIHAVSRARAACP